MALFHVTAAGNITADPELRYTRSGIPVVNFMLLVNHREKDAQGNWVDSQPSRIRVNVWRDQAVNVADSLHKGMEVLVSGSARVVEYDTRDGAHSRDLEITADRVAPSLMWATADVQRAQRNDSQQSQQQSQSRGGFSSQQPASDPWNNAQPQQPQQGTQGTQPPF